MRRLITNFYDSYPGLSAALIITAGLIVGGFAAYRPTVPDEIPPGATQAPPEQTPTQASISLEVPTPTPGATPENDFGTIVAPEKIIIFEDPDGFESAPLQDPDGGVFLTGSGGNLYAVDPSGTLRWEAELAGAPVGDLLMTSANRIITADRSGRLAAYDTGGVLVWEYFPAEGASAVSGPALGPDGSLYYMVESAGAGLIQAVNPGGTLRWEAAVETLSFRTTPWVHPDAEWIFLRTEAFSAVDGSPAEIEFPFEVEKLLTATDGTPFLLSGPTVAAWTLVDGAITLPDDGLRYAVPVANALIDHISINPAGLSWISYIGDTSDGVTWFNPDGSMAHQIVSSNMLLNHALTLDETGTLYACGWSPRNVSGGNAADRTTYCMAYVLGEEDYRWRKLLTSSPTRILGAVRQGNEIFIPTEGGDLYVLGRSETPLEETTLPGGASALPNGWFWQSPSPIINTPALLPDGSLPLLLEDGSVYFLGVDGSLAGHIELPAFRDMDDLNQLPVLFFEDQIAVAIMTDRVYAMQADTGLLWEFPALILDPGDEGGQNAFLRYYSGNGVEYLLDSSNTLFAFTPLEGLRWSFTLEEGLLEDFGVPVLSESGRLYVTDSIGRLFAFDSGGLIWDFHPGGSLRGASDPALGPDGNVYYVATSGSTGLLHSLTPEGDLRWAARLNTFRFYFTPRFSGGGDYIRVAEDFIAAESGQVQPIEFPFEVEDFIEGLAGNDYLWTGDHVIRWQIDSNGYQEIRSFVVNMERSNDFFRPHITIHANGDLEISIFDSNGFRHMWVNGETGEVYASDAPFTGIRMDSTLNEPGFVSCEQDLEAMSMTCTKTLPGASEPVWRLAIHGINGEVSGFPPPIFYQDGRLYLIGDSVNVYMLEVEIP